MDFINIVVFEKDKDKVVDAIIESGVVHLVKSENVNKFIKDEKGIYHYKETVDIHRLKTKIQEAVEKFQIKPEAQNIDKIFRESKQFDIREEVQKLEKIIFEFDSIQNKAKNIEAEINRYNQMLDQINILKTTGYKFTKVSKYEFLEFRIGEINSSLYEKLTTNLENLPVVIFPVKTIKEKIIIYVISLRKSKFKVDEILRKYQFEDIQFSEEIKDISDNIIQGIREKIEKLNKEKVRYLEKTEEIVKTYRAYLEEIFFKTKLIELKNKVNNYFFKTSKTYIISGWTPKRERYNLINILEKLVGKNYYIEILKPAELKGVKDIPVDYSNPKILKPFEEITYNYGTPVYKTINPVPILAVTYLIMFGIMFGDVGHGLVLFLTGIILRMIKKIRKSSVTNLLPLISYCGISSMVFGILFGSVFGYENIIKPLWLRPIENINTLFGLAIGFGISVITIGIIINIINSFITGDLILGIFSKSGLIGGIIYWGIIIIASKIFVLKEEPKKSLYFIFIWIPLILIFLKEPITKIIEHKKKMFGEGFGIYIMENIVEIIEIVIGYISNTMSFIRIIAFGLAHAGLFVAIFSLIEILKKSGAPGFVSIIILIFGNIGIILLEGLVVSIQAMRLEYYEFFDKFFKKTGVRYEPIKI